jgi:hypothetical protein
VSHHVPDAELATGEIATVKAQEIHSFGAINFHVFPIGLYKGFEHSWNTVSLKFRASTTSVDKLTLQVDIYLEEKLFE